MAAEITQTAQTAINAWTETEGGPERQKAAFIVALNNLQSSISCIAELKAWLSDDFRKQFSQVRYEIRKLGLFVSEIGGETNLTR